MAADKLDTTLSISSLAHALTMAFVACALICIWTGTAFAIPQTEPGAYANLPVGLNYLEVTYSDTDGNVSFDTDLPIEGLEGSVSAWTLRYLKYFEAGGQVGRYGLMLPWARVSGSIRGTPISGSNDGFADPILYVTRSFRGAPALDLEGFMGYQQDTIVAGALMVQMSLGQYDSDRVLNVGTNRWVFKPEVAVSRARGPWTYELYGNVQLFTDNDDYLGNLTLEQDVIWGLEGHLIRDLKEGRWASLDLLYANGGETSIDGLDQGDGQSDWYIGANVVIPVSMQDTLGLVYLTDLSTNGGPEFDSFTFFYIRAW